HVRAVRAERLRRIGEAERDRRGVDRREPPVEPESLYGARRAGIEPRPGSEVPCPAVADPDLGERLLEARERDLAGRRRTARRRARRAAPRAAGRLAALTRIDNAVAAEGRRAEPVVSLAGHEHLPHTLLRTLVPCAAAHALAAGGRPAGADLFFAVLPTAGRRADRRRSCQRSGKDHECGCRECFPCHRILLRGPKHRSHSSCTQRAFTARRTGSSYFASAPTCSLARSIVRSISSCFTARHSSSEPRAATSCHWLRGAPGTSRWPRGAVSSSISRGCIKTHPPRLLRPIPLQATTAARSRQSPTTSTRRRHAIEATSAWFARACQNPRDRGRRPVAVARPRAPGLVAPVAPVQSAAVQKVSSSMSSLSGPVVTSDSPLPFRSQHAVRRPVIR